MAEELVGEAFYGGDVGLCERDLVLEGREVLLHLADRVLPLLDDACEDISLVLDHREGRSDGGRVYDTLISKGIRVQRRELAVGDVAWIATERYPMDGPPREFVLDFILERKRMASPEEINERYRLGRGAKRLGKREAVAAAATVDDADE